ncbi:MAG: PucR family transcriptional regulator ligand-binding domain-containing protein [Clostridia bacterium]|nr:PucR family transcriptional regulator ligand-binding domain-containing protein [Clostridia bacterium]
MKYTVNDFLNIPILKKYEILNENADRNHIIEHICVTEPPAEGFVRRNELVLSTLLGCDDDDKIIKFISDLENISASALVISLKDSQKISQNVYKAIQNSNLSVIVIPWEYRFAEIVEAVLSNLRKHNEEDEKKFSMLQKTLLQLFMDQKTLFDASEAISKAVGVPSAVSDMDGNIYYRNFIFSAGKKADDYDFKTPIEIKNRFYGYIICDYKKNELETESVLSLLMKYAVLPLSLWFEREQTAEGSKQQKKSDFIWSLASDSYTNTEELKKNAYKLDIDLDLPYLCVTAKAGFIKSDSFLDETYWIELNNSAIQSEMSKTGAVEGRNILTTFQNGIFILYIQVMPGDNIFTIYKLIDSIEIKIKTYFPRLSCTWGISGIYNKKQSMSRLYIDAKLAMDICYRQKGLGFRNSYNDTGLFRILSAASEIGEIKKTVYDTLNPIIEHDKNHSQNFMDTLNVLFENNFNICKTSRALFIHRQTLLYRIKKIESITGMSLSNHNDTFMLEICIRLFMSFYYTSKKE